MMVTTPLRNYRILSIDLLRGLVMIIMALDHVRDYFNADALRFEPEDLSQTTPLLFFTRWITHFSAPVFAFLAGSSAFLSGQSKTKKELSLFLLSRGVWLIFIEVTVVSFAWSFNIKLPFTGLQVIWALGLSMIALAALIHLPKKIILAVGIIIVAGHNLLDNIHFSGFGWAALHEEKLFHLDNSHLVRVTYPFLPWIGIMALGYCFGSLYTSSFTVARRKNLLLLIGGSSIALFIFLRIINFYGDPLPWTVQKIATFTILSFLNLHKYPPSLLYILMTLGPAMIFLAFTEKVSSRFTRPIIHIGRVPMFYYILHLYLIHLAAMIAAQLSGYRWIDMILQRRTWVDPQLKGYGFSIGFTYVVWIGIVLMLYPLCKWYDKYKTTHKEKWWLSYL
ncbi:MAG TPA: heparan-alpha-glucosaminide N-acetyltransferase domain-containing protein [Chitinophagaceae bacterium]|nr:heparan-alpha-glucosaminide N-acetyltransferase domain-containing protein [Chitinophagaceae bacterium]